MTHSDAATNRPIRHPRHLVLTVGQGQGGLAGQDDKVIQAGVEYLHRLGGGVLRILAGTYTLRNAIHLRPHVTLQGEGEATILSKAASVTTPLARDSDWFEYGVQVRDPKGFTPGGGIMLRSRTGPGEWQFEVMRATVTEVRGNILYLDRLTQKDFWTERSATAETLHPLLTGEDVDDVTIADLVLDGGRDRNAHVNGNFSGAVFLQHCDRWRFERVTARDYNGDGFSFQVCDDVVFQDCRATDNADLGFHPGSGSQRPVLRGCTANGNRQGLYFCWAVSDGLAEQCTMARNTEYGISIGHRDTDNRIRCCALERNGKVGILFRDEGGEFRGGHRNTIEDCTILDTGDDGPGVGIDIQGRTRDITILGTRLVCSTAGRQRTGIRIGAEAQGIHLEGNTFEGCAMEVEDLRT